MIAGDTELGVRLVSILLALPMSYAIYRTAAILFGGARVAATSAILLNVTMMAAVGTLIVTPDAPLLVASSFVLFFLAKVLETGRGAWWLAVGAAVGAALLSKYTAMFFGPAILIWLVAVPKLRRWFLSPWPYLGGLVAFALFSPVILWNADHQWVSFVKQLGRARIEDFRPVFIAELIPTQIAFATPLVFILGAMGLHALIWRAGRRAGLARADQDDVLDHRRSISSGIRCMPASRPTGSRRSIRPSSLPRPPPPISCSGNRARGASWISACAGPRPMGIVMFALLIVQANTGWLSGYRRDATVRSVGVGWRELAAEIEAVRARVARPACSRRTTAPPAGSPSICRAAPASCSRTSASAGSTCPSPIQSCLRAS